MIAAMLAQSAAGMATLPPWELVEQERCELVRRLPNSGKPVELSVFVQPLSAEAYFNLALPAMTGPVTISSGEAGSVLLLPGDNTLDAHWSRATDGKGTTLSFELTRRALIELRTTEQVRLKVGAAYVATVPVAGLGAKLPLLETCTVARLRRLGVDASEELAVAAGAPAPELIGSEETWFSSDNYPVGALQNNEQGRVTSLWTVSPAGRATDCRVVESSGSRALDDAACDIIIAKARYRPIAKPAHAMMSVNWILPRGRTLKPLVRNHDRK